MEIRKYINTDLDQCLEIFDSNHPKYFTKEERSMFIKWLDDPNREEYYVLQNNEQVLACGGLFHDRDKKSAGLAWGMVHSKYHSMGYGTCLTNFRMEKLLTEFIDVDIKIVTSQYTVGFYEKFGFVTESITKDGFGEGLDKYEMRKQDETVLAFIKNFFD